MNVKLSFEELPPPHSRATIKAHPAHPSYSRPYGQLGEINRRGLPVVWLTEKLTRLYGQLGEINRPPED